MFAYNKLEEEKLTESVKLRVREKLASIVKTATTWPRSIFLCSASTSLVSLVHEDVVCTHAAEAAEEEPSKKEQEEEEEEEENLIAFVVPSTPGEEGLFGFLRSRFPLPAVVREHKQHFLRVCEPEKQLVQPLLQVQTPERLMKRVKKGRQLRCVHAPEVQGGAEEVAHRSPALGGGEDKLLTWPLSTGCVTIGGTHV